MTSAQSDRDWAVRVAKAELERDDLRKRLDDMNEVYRQLASGSLENFTLFGQPPEYWLHIQNALRQIQARSYSGLDATLEDPASVIASRALRWKPEESA